MKILSKRKRNFRFYALTLQLTAFYSLLLPNLAAAQVSAGGLRTRVNGSAFGTCISGQCTINGGSRSGQNLLQKFNSFDTRKGITKIKLDTQGLDNIVVGVTSGSGTFLNKPLSLSAPANLFWLSPGGIWVGNGAMVSNVNNLLFTTSIGMKIGGNFYSVFNTKTSDIHLFNQSPDLHFSEIGIPDGTLNSLGLLGNGPIQFQGGQIEVDRNLLVHATAGNLSTASGYGTQLHAGRSVWLSGHGIDLQDVAITAGEPGRWGLVDVRSVPVQGAAQQGSLQLNGALLKGQQIWMSAGGIALNQSRLEAPKGWIQLIANNASDPTQSLTISGSVLNVSASRLEDLNAPALNIDIESYDALGRESLCISYPRIGLLSKGDINISQDSILNASLDLSKFKDNPSVAQKLDLFQLADRSGLIFLRAEGKITLNSSTVTVDSSHTKAGRIFFIANGIDDKGGISLDHSKLWARYGAGDGDIFFKSSGGIKLNYSSLDVSSDKYPIVHGQTSEFVDLRAYGLEGVTVQPYTFFAGKIYMTNNSDSNPIQMNHSNLMGGQTTSGGGLESPLFGFRDVFVEGEYMGKIGILGKEDSFTSGYEYFTGGRIRLYSEGGINIADSTVNISSGEPPYDSMAGTMHLVDKSSAGIKLSNSSINAIASASPDSSNKNVMAGGVIIQAKNLVDIRNSSILVNNLNPKVDPLMDSFNYASPFIIVYSDDSSLSFPKSTLEANYIHKADFASDSFAGINLFPAPSMNEQVRFSPDPLIIGVSFPTDFFSGYIIDDVSQTYSNAETTYGITNINQFIDPNPGSSTSLFLPANPVQFNYSLLPKDSLSASIVIDENSASSQFLESQNRTLIETTKALGLPSGSGRLRSIAELQQRLILASKRSPAPDLSTAAHLGPASTPTQPQSIRSRVQPYTPAIVHLQRDDQPSGQTLITAILLTPKGEPISRSTQVARADLDGWIRSFQRQLSRRSPQPDPSRDPGVPLAKALIDPLLPLLRAQGITALLLEVDRGLQAVPYGALPVEGRPLADLYTLTITPSLGLIELDPGTQASRGQLLLAGASQFSNGLAPLPRVRQELQALAQEHPSRLLLDDTFTPTALIDQALSSQVNQLHIATHANFLPGQTGVLYTPTTTLSLADLGRRLRSRNSSLPLELITMSGCLTALGDGQSELGFVGMALQAGARSGLGTLWEVDDTATAAFFIELYRFLKLGLPKDQALQATQQAFLRGQVRLLADKLVGPDPQTGQAQSTLVAGLTQEEQILFAQGLSHPYYWAGMILTGSPW